MADVKPDDKTSGGQLTAEDYEWLEFQDTYGANENRYKTQMLNNPLVPIGMFATVLALGLGITNMLRQNSKKQQFYMRARVGAQGFTIASLVAGMFYHAAWK